MNEEQMEKQIDRRVQARLATDRDYLNAENAEQQAWAERKVELQEELYILRGIGVLTPSERDRVEEVERDLEAHLVEVAGHAPALDSRAQESLDKRVERGEELLQIVWGRKVEGDDRETAAKDAISDILTALLGPAGVAHFHADGTFNEVAINDFRINEAARITSQAVDSYQGDAEDYVTV